MDSITRATSILTACAAVVVGGAVCCGPAVNAIVAENARTDGVVPRTRWDRTHYDQPAPKGSVEGFATQFSVAPGDTVQFKVKSPSTSYQYEIYRLGWYGGNGARQVFPVCDVASPAECPRITITNNPSQPPCNRYPNPPNDPPGAGTSGPDTVPDCWNWRPADDPNASWHVDSNAVSGVYIARLSNISDPEDVSQVPFVVREAASRRADVLYQLGDSTWQAYNQYDDTEPDSASSSYYDTDPPGLVRAVSYNRPWRNRVEGTGIFHGPKQYLFDLDLPLIRFLERNGISVGYAGSADLEAWPPPSDSSNPLALRKVYLANGHEEYWPGRRLQNLEAAADSNLNMLFMCANTAYFKTRFVPDGEGTPRRVQVAYKIANGQFDPLRNDDEWTGLYRDTRPNAWDSTVPSWTRPRNAPAGSSNSLTGVTPAAVNQEEDPTNVPNMAVPQSMRHLRIWRNTECWNAENGCTLGVANVGFEMDLRADRYSEPFVASQPPGLFSIAATVASLTTTNGPGPPEGAGYSVPAFADAVVSPWPHMTIEATMHRKSSGALVFASSVFRWSQSLDDARSVGVDTSAVSPDMQQATINLLADMYVQPGSLMPGLVPATASTDRSAPVSQLTVLNRATGFVSGTASDEGGVVAGVEVSFDGGTTWHGGVLTQAAETTTWSYMSVVPANVNPLVRAVDDSGNLEVEHGPACVFPESDGLEVTTIGVSPLVDGIFSQQTAPPGLVDATPGWTSLIPMDLDGDALTDLLSYNVTTGSATYARAVAGSPGLRTVVNSVHARPGWTSIVPMDIDDDRFTDLLSYNARTGLAYFSVRVAPGEQQIVGTAVNVPPGSTPGWTSIVPMKINDDRETDLLWYNSATGLAVYTVAVGAPPGYTQQVFAVVDAAPGWTSIVPMRMNVDERTDLLFYNATTGLARYSVGIPATSPQEPQSEFITVNAAPGWTSIIPMELNGDALTDLLSYNAATGLEVFSVGVAPGEQDARSEAHGAEWWTSIVPMKVSFDTGRPRNTDLLFYK
jgi:N,N-dimethylformamidase beta subunit-like protein